jgi:hypothetical protein
MMPNEIKMEKCPLGLAIRKLLVTLANDVLMALWSLTPDCSELRNVWEARKWKSDINSYQKVRESRRGEGWVIPA